MSRPEPTLESIASAWVHKTVNFEREVIELPFLQAEWIDTCLAGRESSGVEEVSPAPTLPHVNLTPVAEYWAEYFNRPVDEADVDICNFAHNWAQRSSGSQSGSLSLPSRSSLPSDARDGVSLPEHYEKAESDIRELKANLKTEHEDCMEWDKMYHEAAKEIGELKAALRELLNYVEHRGDAAKLLAIGKAERLAGVSEGSQ